MMILQLFIFSILFFIIGIIMFVKKKKALGYLFLFIGIMGILLAIVVVNLYPYTIPF
ncbi:MAG: hypothetical protein KKG99_05330 [Bacteroidetes bacterium]|nr:hypothetical protein [Bacteroidota bacterium]